MKTELRLADNTIVSVNSIYILAKAQLQSVNRKIEKLMTKYSCKNEYELDEGSMSDVDQVAYSCLSEARQDIRSITSALMVLADTKII